MQNYTHNNGRKPVSTHSFDQEQILFEINYRFFSLSYLGVENIKKPTNQAYHPFYNEKDVLDVWKQCIQYLVPFRDPIHDHIEQLYKENIIIMTQKINQQKLKVARGTFFFLPIDFTCFDQSSLKVKKTLASMYAHEVRMFQRRHKKCYKCQGVSIVKDYTSLRYENNTYQCSSCRHLPMTSFWKQNSDMMLPVWYDDNHNVHFEVPCELQNLRLGEQLLIQRLSCFVPIVHIKHGTMGIHGNCVCFRQNTAEICNILPRTRVNAIKIIRSYKSKDFSIGQNYDIFVIRKDVVMQALKWLKKDHRWYRDDPDLHIDESNLDWMGNKNEAQLINIQAETSNSVNSTEYDSLMHEQDDEDQNGEGYELKIIYRQYVQV